MPGRFAVAPTPRAADQIRKASSWWRIHRTAAPNALFEELEQAFELLAMQPGIGARASNADRVRRLFLGRTGYYLYYRVDPAESRVEILALWHSRRGAGPSQW